MIYREVPVIFSIIGLFATFLVFNVMAIFVFVKKLLACLSPFQS